MSDHAILERKPEWLKIDLKTQPAYKAVRESVHGNRLHTVCEEAKCPNIHECWGRHRTATFMVLGDICTRRCRFCAVKTGLPRHVDEDEAERVANSVREMGLEHVVVTMVNRDDLPEGGATQVAACIMATRQAVPSCSIEVLCSDFMGDRESIRRVVDAKPDVNSHNIETVRRLTPTIRSRASYERSLLYLKTARQLEPGAVLKSSLMLGLGESQGEVQQTLDDLLKAGCNIVNIGQYLQPTRNHAPVVRYWTPEEFVELKQVALTKGFMHCDAGPLVRSSYHAGIQYKNFKRKVST